MSKIDIEKIHTDFNIKHIEAFNAEYKRLSSALLSKSITHDAFVREALCLVMNYGIEFSKTLVSESNRAIEEALTTIDRS